MVITSSTEEIEKVVQIPTEIFTVTMTKKEAALMAALIGATSNSMRLGILKNAVSRASRYVKSDEYTDKELYDIPVNFFTMIEALLPSNCQ